MQVKKVEEKPKVPPSNLTIMPIYLFKAEIFDLPQNNSPRLRQGIPTDRWDSSHA
jgi:dTDP-glucose pyrophosphorylase